MSRPWHIWAAFAACACLAIAAAGWVSVKALQADANEAAARMKAVVEENTRLALWRMDSLMAPFVAQETARPYFVYEAFYPADRAYSHMFNGLPGQESVAVLPSPLAAGTMPFVRLHFQIDPANHCTSPQGQPVASLLAALTDVLDGPSIVEELPSTEALGNASLSLTLPPRALEQSFSQAFTPQNATLDDEQQIQRGQVEYEARNRYVQGNVNDNWQYANPQQTLVAQATNAVGETKPAAPGAVTRVAPAAEVQVSVMKPFWKADEILLARRVVVSGREYVQGCVLDWPAIRARLLAETADLLPNASLVGYDVTPSNAEDESRDVRLLASLPVRLIPGVVPLAVAASLTPVRLALLVGWAALIMAAGAVMGLLQGVMSLSERRAAFVSAVTHELRTPLTTFRMYSEMLAQGMVRDEADRQRYLETLRVEADRLTHLVANVLAYARLERGRPGGRLEVMSVDRLLDVATERLEDRSTQAGFTLTISVPEDVGTSLAKADASIVEQILFNLVDNACKYAAAADDKTLALSATLDRDVVVIRLCDRGPGISPRGQKLLFQPFRKSASDAAATAPGVGLGLALSRRLARDMGGDLRYEPQASGTCLALRVPRG